MEKVNLVALADTAAMKTELQYMVALVKNMDQGQIRTIESLKSEVESLKIGVIDGPCLEGWSKDMDLEITPVLELLDEQMNHQ